MQIPRPLFDPVERFSLRNVSGRLIDNNYQGIWAINPENIPLTLSAPVCRLMRWSWKRFPFNHFRTKRANLLHLLVVGSGGCAIDSRRFRRLGSNNNATGMCVIMERTLISAKEWTAQTEEEETDRARGRRRRLKNRPIVLISHVNPLMLEIISVLFTVIIITMQKHQRVIYFHSGRPVVGRCCSDRIIFHTEMDVWPLNGPVGEESRRESWIEIPKKVWMSESERSGEKCFNCFVRTKNRSRV